MEARLVAGWVGGLGSATYRFLSNNISHQIKKTSSCLSNLMCYCSDDACVKKEELSD